MRSVIYGTAVGRPRRLRRRPGRRLAGGRRGHAGLGGRRPSCIRLLEAERRPAAAARRCWSAAGRCPRTCSSEALGRGATVVQTYGLTETASQVTTLSPGEARAQARVGRPAAAHHPPADPGRRDPGPGTDRRARRRRRGRLAPHRRPRADRRRGLPLRHRPARRRDRHRGRERAPGRGRGGAAAPPGGRRGGGGRPRRPRVAGGGRRPWSCASGDAEPSADDLRRHCARAARRPQGPEARSSSSPSCRAPPRASCSDRALR